MDHLPTSQEYPHGSMDDWGEPFALPAPRKLPKQMHWRCAHCGAANSSAEATLYHWPDRPKGKRAGYVVCCRQCGCRGQLLRELQPQPVPHSFNLVKIFPLVFVLLAAALVAFSAQDSFSVFPKTNDIVVPADISSLVSLGPIITMSNQLAKSEEALLKVAEDETALRKAEGKAVEEKKKDQKNADKITLQYYDITIVHVGDGYQFRASGGDGKSYSWKSADESVATVTADGYLCATGVGRTTVTCTSGNASAEVVVRVRSN